VKFIHTADWHIGALRTRLPDDYLQRAHKMIRGISAVVESRSDGVLVMAGDVFDRKHVTNEERDLLLSELMRLDKIGVTLVFINGNHDITQPEMSNLGWLSILCKYKKLHMEIADCKPKITTVRDVPFVLYPPRVRDDPKLTPTVIRAYLKKRNLRDAIVVSHFRVGGTVGETNKALPGVDKEDIRVDKYVQYWALGDVHSRQPVRKGAWYCGSPVQHKRNDALPKGVLLVDTEMETPQEIDIESTPLDTYEAIAEGWLPKMQAKLTVTGDISTADIRSVIPLEVAKHIKARGLGDEEAKPMIDYVNKVLASIAEHR